MSRERIQKHTTLASEAELLKRLRVGEGSAQAEVVRNYQRHLLHKAFAIVRDHGLAEDAVQDTWIAVFKNVQRFKGRSAFRTWVMGIVINRARAYCRVRKRLVSCFAVLDGSCDHPESTSEPVDPHLDEVTAERLLLERESAHMVKRAISRLPSAQRSVLLLHIEGFTAAETNSALTISDMARRIRLCRGRARLRKVFQWHLRQCA